MAARTLTYVHSRLFARLPKPDETRLLVDNAYNAARKMGMMPQLVRISVEMIEDDGTNHPTDTTYVRAGDNGISGPTHTGGNTIRYTATADADHPNDIGAGTTT